MSIIEERRAAESAPARARRLTSADWGVAVRYGDRPTRVVLATGRGAAEWAAQRIAEASRRPAGELIVTHPGDAALRRLLAERIELLRAAQAPSVRAHNEALLRGSARAAAVPHLLLSVPSAARLTAAEAETALWVARASAVLGLALVVAAVRLDEVYQLRAPGGARIGDRIIAAATLVRA